MSAFGYFGSKLRIASKLCGHLPPHNAWVELFCGSAAMTLAKEPAQIEVINDINGQITNFFKQLRENSDELIRQIELTPYSREEFELSRIEQTGLTPIERARRFFVAAMMAINGSFGDAPGGFSFSNSYARGGVEARVGRWNGMAEARPGLEHRAMDCLRPRRNHRDRIGAGKKDCRHRAIAAGKMKKL